MYIKLKLTLEKSGSLWFLNAMENDNLIHASCGLNYEDTFERMSKWVEIEEGKFLEKGYVGIPIRLYTKLSKLLLIWKSNCELGFDEEEDDYYDEDD